MIVFFLLYYISRPHSDGVGPPVSIIVVINVLSVIYGGLHYVILSVSNGHSVRTILTNWT